MQRRHTGARGSAAARGAARRAPQRCGAVQRSSRSPALRASRVPKGERKSMARSHKRGPPGAPLLPYSLLFAAAYSPVFAARVQPGQPARVQRDALRRQRMQRGAQLPEAAPQPLAAPGRGGGSSDAAAASTAAAGGGAAQAAAAAARKAAATARCDTGDDSRCGGGGGSGFSDGLPASVATRGGGGGAAPLCSAHRRHPSGGAACRASALPRSCGVHDTSS